MNLFSGSEEAEEIFDQLGTNPTFIENRLQSVGVYPSEATVDFLKLVLVYHSE